VCTENFRSHLFFFHPPAHFCANNLPPPWHLKNDVPPPPTYPSPNCVPSFSAHLEPHRHFLDPRSIKQGVGCRRISPLRRATCPAVFEAAHHTGMCYHRHRSKKHKRPGHFSAALGLCLFIDQSSMRSSRSICVDCYSRCNSLCARSRFLIIDMVRDA
jgi:hypothetical protein